MNQTAQNLSPHATISVSISPGELLDKISILELKSMFINDAAKQENIHYELDLLRHTQEQNFALENEVKELYLQLKQINAQLWEIEDNIRICEREKNFGTTFIELARSVYKTNDRRAELKRAINLQLGSTLIEEKSYSNY